MSSVGQGLAPPPPNSFLLSVLHPEGLAGWQRAWHHSRCVLRVLFEWVVGMDVDMEEGRENHVGVKSWDRVWFPFTGVSDKERALSNSQ